MAMDSPRFNLQSITNKILRYITFKLSKKNLFNSHVNKFTSRVKNRSLITKLSQLYKNNKIKFVVIPITLIIFVTTIVLIGHIKDTSLKDEILILVNISIYVLFFLIVTIIRSAYKTYFEKKGQLWKSGFGKKLTTTFVGFIMIPTMILFVLSGLLITYTIDKWFSLEFKIPIKNAQKVTKVFIDREKELALKSARILASLKSTARYTEVKEIIQENLFLNDPAKIYTLNKTDGSAVVSKAFQGKSGFEEFFTDAGNVIRAVVPVKNKKGISEVIIVETVIDSKFVDRMSKIMNAYEDYNQIKSNQSRIKLFYFLVLAIATLLIINLSSWISLRIAREITGPILSLSEAARSVANGNMNVQINISRNDEIGLLINSFNSMVVDIHQGKLSLEEAYRESDIGRLTLEAILENINTGVIFIDNKGIIMTVNNSASKILDIDCREFVGMDYRNFIAYIESQELLSIIRKISESRFKFVEKEVKISIDEKSMHLRLSLMAMEDYQSIPMGVLVVFEDLTELIKAQRAMAWQEVARRMAHEIKNPLTPIKLSAERLIRKWNKKSPDFDDVFQRATKTIIKEVDSLKLLVDEFSRLGKMPEINKKLCDLNALLAEIMELYKDCKGTKFTTDFHKIPLIALDKEQIKRFIINLVDNAIQAMARHVIIRTSHNSALDKVLIEVADDGTGIKKEDKDKLFLPYFSTKKSGTGLGLAIADKIISDHGGHIKVIANVPKGTRFVTVLPLGV